MTRSSRIDGSRGFARLDAGDRVALYAMAVVAWLGAGIAAVVTVLQAVSWFMIEEPTFPMDTTGSAVPGADWSAVVTSADVTATIGNGARALFAVSDVLALPWIAAVAATGYLFFIVAGGAQFGRRLTVVTAVVGPALAIGGLLRGATSFFGTAIAWEDLGSPDELVVSAPFPVAQILIGLALGALAYLFSRGSRLERDTEGLV